MSSTADQYRIIAAGAGWLDRIDRGRLRFDGRDATSFLQALLTNDVQALTKGQGVYAAYLTPQGRMVADLRVHHCGEHLVAQVAAAQAASLAQRFDQLIFSEDVRVADVSGSVAQLAVIGAHAAGIIAEVFALDAAQLGQLAPLGHLSWGDVAVARADDVDLPAFDVFLPPAARDAAVDRFQELGAAPVSIDFFDALRIDAGRPAYGVDMTEDTIPLEAGLLERAISTSKGCYVGQEIIIRVLHRGGGRVAKRLVKLVVESDGAGPPAAGTHLLHDLYEGREVGRITSAARSPRTGAIVALGYVHRDHAALATRLGVPADAGGGVAEITGFAG
jgi:folate-binding protein YgfZ